MLFTNLSYRWKEETREHLKDHYQDLHRLVPLNIFYSLPFQAYVDGLDLDVLSVSRMSDYIEKVMGEDSSA